MKKLIKRTKKCGKCEYRFAKYCKGQKGTLSTTIYPIRCRFLESKKDTLKSVGEFVDKRILS